MFALHCKLNKSLEIVYSKVIEVNFKIDHKHAVHDVKIFLDINFKNE